jgi:hypothetical protein
MAPAIAALACLGAVSLSVGFAHDAIGELAPPKVVHGQEAGPLEGGGVLILTFERLPVGKAFEEGNLVLENRSKDEVHVDAVNPFRLAPALQLVALRAWLVPKNEHKLLPGGSRDWPVDDPRARFTVPAKNFTIPPHRWMQILFALEPTQPGTHRMEGARITFEAGGKHYDWTLQHVIVAISKPAMP